MIIVNELRIGNKVLDIGPNKIVEVRDIITHPANAGLYPPRYPHLDKIHTNSEAWRECQDIDPIPLSAEILEKCGFERKVSTSEETLVYRTSDGYPVKGLVDNVSYRYKYMLLTEEKSNSFHFQDRPGLFVKYVHQLQNLYFALWGEELEVKL